MPHVLSAFGSLPDVEGKIDSDARRQVTNKLRAQYRRASRSDRGAILDRVVATTGWGGRRRGGCSAAPGWPIRPSRSMAAVCGRDPSVTTPGTAGACGF